MKDLGWEGPYPGGKHMQLRKDGQRVTIPNPHKGELDWSLTKRILDQAGIDHDEWDKLA